MVETVSPDSAPYDPAGEKARLRAEALARRAALSGEARAVAAAEAAGRAMGLMGPVAGRVVSLFSPIRDEIDTRPLAEALWRAGATLALPVVVGRAAPLLFRRWSAGDTLLPSGPFAIPVPGPGAPEVEPDVLMVPLAAFDRRGYRIGYGAGHYDRTLAGLRARRAVRAVGYAFACQEVLFVPQEVHDEPVDEMVTERDVIFCGL